MTSTEDRTVRDAAARISAGGLVAMPTETVYGLAADATNDEAVARIFEAKRRPQLRKTRPAGEKADEQILAGAADAGAAEA